MRVGLRPTRWLRPATITVLRGAELRVHSASSVPVSVPHVDRERQSASGRRGGIV
jgi:hypothetical protein